MLGEVIDLGCAAPPAATSIEANPDPGRAIINLGSSQLPLNFTVSQLENARGSNLAYTITGNIANNSLSSASGNDAINGSSANHILIGGLSGDTRTGGLGNDVFKYTGVTESAAGATSRDTIADCQLGVDKLELGAIDANSLIAIDQAFNFLDNSATFTNAGQLRYQLSGGNPLLFGNIYANFATSEFEPQLSVASVIRSVRFRISLAPQ